MSMAVIFFTIGNTVYINIQTNIILVESIDFGRKICDITTYDRAQNGGGGGEARSQLAPRYFFLGANSYN